jgi:hypothetical protein
MLIEKAIYSYTAIGGTTFAGAFDVTYKDMCALLVVAVYIIT